jgi:crotonobetainyl-CoA:carnitine CoA-transferase CaiB-like acyl-CoA transferase
MDVLGGAVPAAPVLDVAQALDNPFVREGGRIAEFTGGALDAPIRMLAGPVRIAGETLPTRGAPALGADTESVLGRIGIDAGRLADLRGRGVV